MESKITEIKANDGSEITVEKPQDTRAFVTLRQKSKKQGVPFELAISLDSPYQPVSIVEVFDADVKLGEKKAPAPVEKRPEPFADLADFGPQPGSFVTQVEFR